MATYPARFRETFWPPAAVLAWLVWHSPAVVKECWGGSIETIRDKLDQDGPLAHVLDYAMERLLSVLRQDCVSSSGLRAGASDPENITARQWALGRLRFATDAQGKDYITNEEHIPEEGDADDIWNAIERNKQKRRSGCLVRFDAPGLCRDGVLKAFPMEVQTAPMVHGLAAAPDCDTIAEESVNASTPSITATEAAPAAARQIRKRGPASMAAADAPLVDEISAHQRRNEGANCRAKVCGQGCRRSNAREQDQATRTTVARKTENCRSLIAPSLSLPNKSKSLPNRSSDLDFSHVLSSRRKQRCFLRRRQATWFLQHKSGIIFGATRTARR